MSALHNTGHYQIGRASDLRTTDTAAAAPASLLRSICEHDARATDPMVGMTTAMSLHEVCRLGASPSFCLIAIWRRIAHDRRGADHRPLDSRIKRPRCAAVDRQIVQKLIAIFLASPHIARVRVLLCAQEVSAMCGRDRPDLAVLSDRRLEWRCRTSRRPSRLAPCAPGSAG